MLCCRAPVRHAPLMHSIMSHVVMHLYAQQHYGPAAAARTCAQRQDNSCDPLLLSTQVLELALCYMSDIKTFAACSQLSQRCRLCTQLATALNLPSLVQHCAAGAGLDGQIRQLKWLCRTAGPAAVNTHAAGCAILNFVGTLDWWEQPMTYWRPGVELAVLAATTVQATGASTQSSAVGCECLHAFGTPRNCVGAAVYCNFA